MLFLMQFTILRNSKSLIGLMCFKVLLMCEILFCSMLKGNFFKKRFALNKTGENETSHVLKLPHLKKLNCLSSSAAQK